MYKELQERIKVLLASDEFIVVLLLLVAFGSFGLGRLSVSEQGVASVSIHPLVLSEEDQSQIHAGISSGEVVASINGSKYHFPWCSGAQRMNEANKITFPSIEAAREAGYLPALNCKGLK